MTVASLDWQLHGRSAAELREMFVDWYFRPLARVLCADHPDVQSVVLAFAQYWDDEANDAVHALVRTAPERDPIWEELARREDREVPEPSEPFLDEESWLAWRDRVDALEIALSEARHREEARIAAAGDEVAGNRIAYFDNGDFIIAFAPFCLEGATQHDRVADAYRPYAVARRAPGGDVEVEIVGTMHQPWREDEHLVEPVLWRFDDLPVERAKKPLSGAPLPLLRAADRVRERQQAARDLAGRMSDAFAARRQGRPVDVEALERAVEEHAAELDDLLGRRR